MTQTQTQNHQWDLEYTDTFSGEANYSWVQRRTLKIPAGASDLAIVRRAKAAMGLNGVRGRTERFGDEFWFYPQGSCTVLFIVFREEA